MTSALIYEGTAMRIDTRVPWYARLFGVPLIAGSLYVLSILFLSLRDVFLGTRESDVLAGQLVLLVFGLLIGLPGVILLLMRSHIEIDQQLGQVTTIREFGFLKIRSVRRLADFIRVTATSEQISGSSEFYNVNLAGQRGTKPLQLAFYGTREKADELGKELAGNLKLPYQDLVDTEPDEDEDEQQDQNNDKA